MTNSEIKMMIENYGLIKVDDKLRITKNKTEAQKNLSAIKAAKPEIMNYLDEEANRLANEQRQKDEVFYNIPGVRELSEARREWAAWHRELNKAMDCGNPMLPKKPESDIEALEKNVIAAWALEVKREALESQDYKISAIGERAFNALRNGENPEAVKATYDAEKAAYVKRNQWN